jgi:hypothetical protein
MRDCDRCGKPGRDRHHRDGNTLNNEPENIECLCRRCHMEIDGRLARFPTLPKAAKARAA